MYPTGTVTFLFSDIQGSTPLWEKESAAMESAVARHNAILETSIQQYGGYVFKIIGDAFQAAFHQPDQAVCAALSAQRSFQNERWPTSHPIRVRMGIHTGHVELIESHEHNKQYLSSSEGRSSQPIWDYAISHTLNRASRVASAGSGGQILLSLATEQLLGGNLPEAVGLRDLGEHYLKGLSLPEHLFQVVSVDLPQDFPPLISDRPARHNLPSQFTSFIGRREELSRIVKLLSHQQAILTPQTTQDNNYHSIQQTDPKPSLTHSANILPHLVTITGTGGVGKTRLALLAAEQLIPQYPQGVWLVELATVDDPHRLVHVIATLFGLREEPGRNLNTILKDYFYAKDLLLILDNCEHLIEACAELADSLLHGCPNLYILASSREALGVEGEIIVYLPSLSFPDFNKQLTIDRIKQYEAVQLFITRAQALQSNFQITDVNANKIIQICQRLDGIPLAIELAAARLRVMTVEQIATRIDDRYRLLTGGSRRALPRHQTLQALIDWSYSLLSESERRLFKRLAVFSNGWDLPSVEAICADCYDIQPTTNEASLSDNRKFNELSPLYNFSTPAIPYLAHSEASPFTPLPDVIRPSSLQPSPFTINPVINPRLDSDVHYSILEEIKPGSNQVVARYQILDLLNQLVNKSLVNFELIPRYHMLETIRQYAESKLLESGESSVIRRRHLAYYRQLAEENELNMMTDQRLEALQKLQVESANINIALGWAFSSEHDDEVIEGLRLAGALGQYWLMKTLYRQGRDWLIRGLTQLHSTDNLDQSLDYIRAKATLMAGLLSLYFGEISEMRQLIQESMQLTAKAADPTMLAMAKGLLGIIYLEIDPIKARKMADECIYFANVWKHPWYLAMALNFYGSVLSGLGELKEARSSFEESIPLFQKTGDRWTADSQLAGLGDLAIRDGDYEKAKSYFQKALESSRELGFKWGIRSALSSLRMIARLNKDYPQMETFMVELYPLDLELGNEINVIYSLRCMGVAALHQGKLAQAARYFLDSYQHAQKYGDSYGILTFIADSAALILLNDNVSRDESFKAIQLVRAVDQLFLKFTKPMDPEDKIEYDLAIQIGHQRLSKDEYHSAWVTGRKLTQEKALENALAFYDSFGYNRNGK